MNKVAKIAGKYLVGKDKRALFIEKFISIVLKNLRDVFYEEPLDTWDKPFAQLQVLNIVKKMCDNWDICFKTFAFFENK